MDLKAQKAQRRVLRTAFTLSANKIEKVAQEAVSGTLLQLEDNGDEFETDFPGAESYREKYLEYYTHIDKKLGETVISEVPDTHQESLSHRNSN
ncbi:hypothetical protein TNCV_3250591 [Trichonephila clavipes]|nr:hypothetical protein TNCV_3250591 [Trichonephila clavipes]